MQSRRREYANFNRLKLPTGSGCVASAIRRVINFRLKASGSYQGDGKCLVIKC